MTGTEARPRDLPSLTSLRAFAAAIVLLFHLDSWRVVHVPGASSGQIGVGFFFVLSGFILTWVARPGPRVAFYVRRLARIYPDHLVTMVAGLLVALYVVPVPTSWRSITANVLLVQAWSPNGAVAFGLNGVSWSLSCEAAFYVAFPFLLVWLVRTTPRVRVAIAVVACAVPVALGLADPSLQGYLFHFPPARLPEFVLGMVVGLAFVDGWRLHASRVLLGGVTAVGLVAADVLNVPEIVACIALEVPFVLLLVACATSDERGRSSLLGTRPLMLAGAASYAFYLVHELVIKVSVDAGARGWLVAVAVTAVAVALAWALYRLVEVPARHRIVEWYRARTARAPAPAAVR